MIILDGKKLAKKIENQLRTQVLGMTRKPVLAMVLVGIDPASEIYIRNKQVACQETGIGSQEILLPRNITQAQLIAKIQELNQDKNITGIIIQLPLPKHIDKYKILEAINPKKDADCLNPLNFGSFFQKGEANFPIGPATPVGIIKLLEEYGVSIEKKYAVLIGYSDIVGKPLSEMLLLRDATVTVCHSKTFDLKKFTFQADILVSATGVRHIITEDMVKKGAVVIDVGISREGKKIFGDTDFENVQKKASYITPVPGESGR